MNQSILTPTLPQFVQPMLAKPGFPFDSPKHLFEVKWDGTRALAFVDQDGYRLVNRHRVDVTDRYPEFHFLANLSAGVIFDGEIVVLRQGKPDFELLLSRNQTRVPFKIQSLARILPATYVVFDLLYDRFESLLALPLAMRRERLEKLGRRCAYPRLVFSQSVVGPGKAFFAEVCRLGLEGVMAKSLASGYQPGRRTEAWIKIKPKSRLPPVESGLLSGILTKTAHTSRSNRSPLLPQSVAIRAGFRHWLWLCAESDRWPVLFSSGFEGGLAEMGRADRGIVR